MRLRRAVPKTPPRSSVPPTLPLHNCRPLRTPSESTLPQLLIPPHFNSFRRNVYTKQGGGTPSDPPQSFATRHYPPLAPCTATVHTNIIPWALRLPLFSYSYALFCTVQSVNSFPLNRFHTLCPKHPGGGTRLNRKYPLLFRPLGCRLPSATMPSASRSHSCLRPYFPPFPAPSFSHFLPPPPSLLRPRLPHLHSASPSLDSFMATSAVSFGQTKAAPTSKSSASPKPTKSSQNSPRRSTAYRQTFSLLPSTRCSRRPSRKPS